VVLPVVEKSSLPFFLILREYIERLGRERHLVTVAGFGRSECPEPLLLADARGLHRRDLATPLSRDQQEPEEDPEREDPSAARPSRA
jgi:hypothetical protein